MMRLSELNQKRPVALMRETFKSWVDDKALRLAAALAYYSIFSVAPMLIIAVSVAGLVFGMEAVRGELHAQLQSYIGSQASEAVQTLIKSASRPRDGWIGTATGIVILVVGATGVFGQLKDALNTVWEVRTIKGAGIWSAVRERLLSFGMVLAIGFLLLTSLVLTTATAALNDYLSLRVGIPAFAWTTAAALVSLGMVTVLFALIFKVLPDVEIKWRQVWVGALVTGILFELGKLGLSFYLGRESTASSYGAAASVVLLLLWIYYASCILLLGAEFTQVYSRMRGHAIVPAKNAVSISTADRANEGLNPTRKTDQPFAATAPEPVKTIAVPAPEPGRALEPAGALLLATTVSFVAGLVFRRWEAKAHSPTEQLAAGAKGLRKETSVQIAEAIGKARNRLKNHRWA